jgi:Rps23 Pro-64 3,4-dihydroxylase Tpa1-like proline 4-hydroxylase
MNSQFPYFFVKEQCIPDNFCDHLISLSESIGFKTSRLNGTMNTDLRNSLSCFVPELNSSLITPQVLKELQLYLESFLPTTYRNQTLKYVNTNNLNILKYGKGNYFKPHTDGSRLDQENNRSLITVQIYLNDVLEGGETNFYNDKGEIVYSVKPKKGSVAFFDHLIVHEGAEVKEGLKYTFRINAYYNSTL